MLTISYQLYYITVKIAHHSNLKATSGTREARNPAVNRLPS